ncbi:hypothetical protein [Aquimarina sp. 2201CG5-10]|uniref:hypothetical protein n=1 Tax=Aquimarina callyspongiae TaxID=3098150 RepID=UPI002AB42B4A|nr:hypothetical protein [Aquimarina sp. 2201CG5-10]MDY8134104.1 hypothetical protein [Aquimarina sp. 2201CG5-10]
MRYKLNTILLSVCCIAGLLAQDKQSKLSEKFTVNKDVTVNLNTSHTDIVFETWNKSTVEVEAYLEGDNLNDDTSKRILDSWQVDVLGNSREITITSAAGNLWTRNITASNVTVKELQELRMLSPAIADMLSPIMENIANNPMPSALPENSSDVSLNYGKNKQDEEKYVKQWESQIKEKFGNNFELALKDWKKQMEQNGQKISPQMEIRIQEAWGNEFARRMSAWSSQFVRAVDNQQQGANITIYQYSTQKTNPNTTTSKKIKIRIPKEAGLRLNIRHGNVKLAERAHNVKASLSHTKLDANIIEGDQTFIKASYSPVLVREWNNGRLMVNYVKNCRIQNAKNLLINADSSNIFIQQLDENGAISGSFGAITIANLGESFSTLDLAVENSDFKLKLPKTAFNFTYSGAQSRIALSKTVEANVRRNFGNVFINGFQNTRNTDKAITINAKYSQVILQ